MYGFCTIILLLYTYVFFNKNHTLPRNYTLIRLAYIKNNTFTVLVLDFIFSQAKLHYFLQFFYSKVQDPLHGIV